VRLQRRAIVTVGYFHAKLCEKTDIARCPGHQVHLDVKKVGRIPDGGGWRTHGRGSDHARTVARRKTKGERVGYVYLHSAVDGYSRLAYTEALAYEKAATAIGFMHRARAWFAAHGITRIERIVTDNGACYRADAFAGAMLGARHQRISPYTPRHNGKVERYDRILAEEFLYAHTWTSEQERSCPRHMEHPLQLPPAAQRIGRPATGLTAHHRRHQPHGLIQWNQARRLKSPHIRTEPIPGGTQHPGRGGY
jgi:transposase InsO family protein